MTMRIALASAVIGFCAPDAAAQVEWRGVRLEGEGRPTTYMPGVAQTRSDTVATALGDMPFTTYFVQDDKAMSGNRLYTLTVVEYPEGSFPPDSTDRIEAFFEGTVLAAAGAVEGEAVISQPLNGAYPGWLFRVDYAAERSASVHNRAYLVGDRYYHQQVFSLDEDGGRKARERYFTAFTPRTRDEDRRPPR